MSTPTPWNFACDSYGKVQHSRKACVYGVVKNPGGERIVTIAGRIEDWDDAKLIVRAGNSYAHMLAALKQVDQDIRNCNGRVLAMHHDMIKAAIEKAEA